MTTMALQEKSVLYAEDDENDMFFMRRAFKRLQMPDALHVVPDGNKAVDYLESMNPTSFAGGKLPLRLLLLDVKMPYRSGLEVLHWVRERPLFATLPVVMMTSSTQEKDVAYATAYRANAYLVKPPNAENLVALVAKLLTLCQLQPPLTGRFDLPGNILPVSQTS